MKEKSKKNSRIPAKKSNVLKSPNKVGRPTKYKPEYNEQAYRLALLGATDSQIAEFFQVNEDTIHEWKKTEPEFSESLNRGKIIADAEVAEGLFKRAKGYRYKEKVFEDAKLKKVVEKELPPDTGAASLWLSNRQRAIWKNRMDVENKNTNTNINSIPLTPDEIKDISKELENEY